MNNFDMNERRDVTGADSGMKQFFQKVYSYMAIAMAVTAVTGFIAQSFFLPQLVTFFAGSWIGTIAIFAVELILVYMIRNAAVNLNPAKAFGLLMTFAVAQGLFLGLLLAVYTGASVLAAFGSTVGLFGGMALYGVFTKKSLAGMGPILNGLLIGVIIAMVINIFMGSSAFQTLISIAVLIVFALFTAYDNNNLKASYNQMMAQGANEAQTSGIAVWGALNLYLDFLNIFYSLLQIFGDQRD
ncbi:Bax inhibitor-1/YccA family protein [Fructobacillus sp. M2-14]|uniref:Bax inhibitor-1/YccA family protein n=1 Tax=Fructobacillus broussonetiae TaxID=2713173 RepID=A0ABS5QXW8_9LACO|nr:Bax inhibitor-1/YccA family protein [Fructobacillus broussonetiae]MBS9338044.1 Bax inhibitor-1/YccA family protein [Fructobacillus broussonetiae]